MTTIEELEKMFKEHLEKDHKEISKDMETLSDEQDWMQSEVDRIDDRLKVIEDWYYEPVDEENNITTTIKSLDERISALEGTEEGKADE